MLELRMNDSRSTEGERFCVCSNAEGKPIGISDEDFGYDVLFRVLGDFGTDAEKIEYLRVAAKALNAAASKIPTGPQADRVWPDSPGGARVEPGDDPSVLREYLRIYGDHIPPCAGRPCECGFAKAWQVSTGTNERDRFAAMRVVPEASGNHAQLATSLRSHRQASAKCNSTDPEHYCPACTERSAPEPAGGQSPAMYRLRYKFNHDNWTDFSPDFYDLVLIPHPPSTKAGES